MTRLISLLLLLPALGRGAVGDVLWCHVETNGWVAQVCVDGFVTNTVAFNNKFLTNNTLASTQGLRIDIVSMGFTEAGAPTTHARTVYGTKVLRRVYPNELTNDIFFDATGTNSVFRVALSDWVYDLDSNLVASASIGGFATTGSVTNCAAITGLSVTNNSTQAYPKVIGNWSWPGWQQWTGTTGRLRMVGFHQSARLGQPLRAVKFIATDESGDAVTNTVTGMTLDRSLPDPWPTGEYVSDFTLSAFTDQDDLRCDFIAYPWIGDGSAVLDTTLNTYVYSSILPSSITNLCDPNGTYAPFIAVVDPTSGNDSNGKATNTTPANVNSAHYFLTVAAAWNQIADSNAPALGGKVFIFTTGGTSFAWTGGALNTDVDAVWSAVWCETATFPGHATAVMTNRNNDRNVGNRTKLTNIRIAVPNTATPFNATDAVWLNQCVVDTDATQLFLTCTNTYLTHCTITNLQQGIQSSTPSSGTGFDLVRGNDFRGFDDLIAQWAVLMGNNHPQTNGGFNIAFDEAAQLSFGFQICYNNFFACRYSTAALLSMISASSPTGGVALVQNVLTQNDAGTPLASIASTAECPSSTNVLIWHNIFEGGRIADLASSGVELSNVWRWQFSIKGNVFAYPGQKDDTASPQSSNRIGGWPVMHMVGGDGNFYIRNNVSGTATSFRPMFSGLNTYEAGLTNVDNFAQWTSRTAALAGGDGSGGGNWRIQSHSPMHGRSVWVLSFDLEGVPRGSIDPPGAYAAGNVRKGGFF